MVGFRSWFWLVAQNFRKVMGTYECQMAFCECKWGRCSTWRWCRHVNSTCCNQTFCWTFCTQQWGHKNLAGLHTLLCPSCQRWWWPLSFWGEGYKGYEECKGWVQRQGYKGESALGHKGWVWRVQQWKGARAWWWKGTRVKSGGVYIIHITLHVRGGGNTSCPWEGCKGHKSWAQRAWSMLGTKGAKARLCTIRTHKPPGETFTAWYLEIWLRDVML